MKKYYYDIFDTEFGYCGVVWSDNSVNNICIACMDYSECKECKKYLTVGMSGVKKANADSLSGLKSKMKGYFRGKDVDFSDFKVDLSDKTPFARKILNYCRKVPSGRTISYGELAGKAGNKKAARAVGAIMSSNPAPVIIPCHRVIKSDGTTGGFMGKKNAAEIKQKILELEKK